MEGLVEKWADATKDGLRGLPRMCLDSVYLEMATGRVVAIKPKPAFLPPFKLESRLTRVR